MKLFEIYGQPTLGGNEENIVSELVKELENGAASFLMDAKRNYKTADFVDWLNDTRANFDSDEIYQDFPHFDSYEQYADDIIELINKKSV